MKLCAKFSFLFLVLVAVIAATSPILALEPAVRKAGLPNQAVAFDELLKQTVVTLDTSSALTATDATATNTEAVYFMPDTYEFPIKLRVQNHGTASITYVPYVTTAAAGVTLPTATASHLVDPFGNAVVSGRAYEGIFYQVPNISIGASGDQEVIVEIWGIKGGITSVSKQAALNGRYCFV